MTATRPVAITAAPIPTWCCSTLPATPMTAA